MVVVLALTIVVAAFVAAGTVVAAESELLVVLPLARSMALMSGGTLEDVEGELHQEGRQTLYDGARQAAGAQGGSNTADNEGDRSAGTGAQPVCGPDHTRPPDAARSGA